MDVLLRKLKKANSGTLKNLLAAPDLREEMTDFGANPSDWSVSSRDGTQYATIGQLRHVTARNGGKGIGLKLPNTTW